MKVLERLKVLVPPEYMIWLPAWVVALALLAGAWLFVQKRRSAKAKGEDKPPQAPVRHVKSIAANTLESAWKEFLNQIPVEFRRIIMVYQHFVVFGDSGAGKSNLINNHTDWQGHARQFYPSYTANPLLQVYLGSKVLVQEIAPAILNDTSRDARVALLRLWKPLFRRKDPTAVVVLNSQALRDDEPMDLKKEAQMIRGKINLLARVRKKPVRVRLVLNNMEAVPGFVAFARFLNDARIPLNLDLGSTENLSELEDLLASYEIHLPRALTTVSAADYLDIITFFKEVPSVLKGLSRYISVLQSPDPLTPEPEVVSLSLSALSDEHPLVSKPFDTTLTSEEIQKYNPVFRHRIIAASIGFLGLAYLGLSFIYEYRLIGDRYVQINAIEKAPLSQYSKNLHPLFSDPVTSLKERNLMDFMPDFFPNANQEIYARGVAHIRDYYIIPELEKISMSIKSWDIEALDTAEEADSRNRVIYLLGLLYATEKNDLGSLVRDNLTVWTENSGLPMVLVEDYAKYNTRSSGFAVDMNDYIYTGKASAFDDPLAIMVFFEKVKKYYYDPVLTKNEFNTLRVQAESFLARIREIERYDLSMKVTELLRREAMLSINTRKIGAVDFSNQIRQKQIKEFLQFLLNSRIGSPDIGKGLNLSGVYDNLKVMKAYKGENANSDTFFQFALAGRDFKFGVARWNDLLNRSRMSQFLNAFMEAHSYQDGLLFFEQKEGFPDLVMNVSNNGKFLFRGQSRVDGRYTRRAFEKRVKPLLAELPAFIEALDIPEKDKVNFSYFLTAEVDEYGRQYASAYREFYREFDIGATSLATFRLVLKQLIEPSSPLMEVLLSIKENTSLEVDENIYLYTFTKHLYPFSFLGQLLAEQKRAYPEMETYRAFLRQMLDELDGKGKESGNPDAFRARLSPLGRITYAQFLGAGDTYYSLIHQWMESVGVPDDWQGAFLGPVMTAYRIGRPEVELLADQIWTELADVNIAPLYALFPFDRTAKNDVSLDVLSAATHPGGAFWKGFDMYLSTFVRVADGTWKLRVSALEPLELPESMLPVLNSVQLLTTSLWTAKGDPLPLVFELKPYPLALIKTGGQVVSLSYLHADSFSIFGFNQQPLWKKAKLDWTRESSASVGLELMPSDGGVAKLYNGANVSRSAWSFFRLLEKSENFRSETVSGLPGNVGRKPMAISSAPRDEAAPGVYTWNVTVQQPESDSGVSTQDIPVRFTLKSRDPWALFKLPGRGGE